MSPAQDKLYWREWGAVSRRCRDRGLPVPDRHELHAAALGADKSHKDFTNADFDKVLAQFRAHSQPDNVAAQLRQLDQPKVRLRHKIMSFDQAYWQAIARDKFGHADLEELDLDQLTQLRNTLAARETSRRRKETAAGSPF